MTRRTNVAIIRCREMSRISSRGSLAQAGVGNPLTQIARERQRPASARTSECHSGRTTRAQSAPRGGRSVTHMTTSSSSLSAAPLVSGSSPCSPAPASAPLPVDMPAADVAIGDGGVLEGSACRALGGHSQSGRPWAPETS